ncbi:acetyl-CoA acyltransferase [Jatrophihabitans sp. GAS493]|uniref:thiolase family protein n=1 Tax=Jatrophihabitans sp. GAS493 TaxID=1907575 RepID=UPI000BB9166F|nr:thiolase family protein [Jatrophihabitans sp. GAS493]SOD72137.1 acetyl-CoA acyltransferase [Jatrophihabitans sp. GAS493]
MRDAVIVGAVRTPIGRRNGAYANVHPIDLSAYVLQGLVNKTGIDPAVIDDVIWGCVQQVGGQSLNPARLAALAAGFPETVPGTSVDRQCGSSQQSVHFAAAAVVSGQCDVVVAGGVESMTMVPMGASMADPAYGAPYGPLFSQRYPDEPNQGVGAEMVAEKWGFSRSQLDEYAVQSHERTAAAIDAGAFTEQYVEIPGTGLTVDQGLRRGTSLDVLAGLKPAFKSDGVIHAGNSSQISDGSGALLITTSEKAAELGLKPLVRLHTFAVAGSDPVIMLTGPIPATAKALARSGLSINEIGAFEINEAFAPVPLAWQVETGADPKNLNPLGGAIAVGHPLGGSGAILMTRLVHNMVDNGIQYGLQSMCEGGGMANATILELL